MIVVLVDPRRPSLVPVEAIELLGGTVQYTEEMPIAVPWSLPDAHPVHVGEEAPVLLSSDPNHPAVVARLAAGARLIAAPDRRRGERLLDAVAMMDKLRTDGPWESEQTHDSLRRYLLEETYELLDAVHSGSVDQLREELGDLLLQVLFHARIAEDAALLPFTIDDVADTLMRKLGNRAPGVLAGESISLQEQMAQWEEGKAAEKARNPRESVLDDVPTGQPALALAQKVIARVCNAGLPVQLIPAEITSIAVSADIDAENCLRAAVLDFSDNVRRAERAIVAARRGDAVAEELDMAPVGTITEQEWLVHWPSGSAGADVAPEPVVDEEPPQEPAEPEEQVEAPAEGETPKESRESRGGSKKRKGRR
ncbi:MULTISPECIES: nucleoside triphosphate pyrophosphohydrolase [Mycobacterium ulcerans group]|uniref:nucleoside triphosphate pyrophosphohydrolase n=1 Tax=Mycobacterium ulcerans group TaxID=2993898 RepID=UPI00035879C8|nr:MULTISPECIES: nucleoside triphosphate pyrophosphohydrolase [Mycobacterium ulcerans group]EPQ78163.1 Nucleoside triphosphate pyrophosphohydrolase [Mycobacterium marinum MB2]MDC8971245.1 nucleoside triphosphate pyrophosphohydrolase [Mycobacterium marinum]RFZ54481.1 Nucleoside triphosphate pyrophosphohydrolase [Mycobacterium marinum]RFZ67043.1 Nucleoside triphosphate pyrophosphohydrolase [Mycobacterium marinum]